MCRFGFLAPIGDQSLEIQKLAVHMRAFDKERLAQRHAAQHPALLHDSAVEDHMAVDCWHRFDVLANAGFRAIFIP
nr:hypothetical protein XF16B_17030 [Bradyrhizobium diazoefficiens]